MIKNQFLSVVICTHNPRLDYLGRVINALRVQSLPVEQWELLVVDNCSEKLVADVCDLSWHPQSRHIYENELGLTPARIRGFTESMGSLVVFVDDDNVLNSDYLFNALAISNAHPWLGAFGGTTKPDFEVTPESWMHYSINELGIRTVKEVAWCLAPGVTAIQFAPIGAGMVVRRAVLDYYRNLCRSEPARIKKLGRKGVSLISCEDYDLALCACKIGLAVGLFPQLELTHIIDKFRIKREYLLKITSSIAESMVLLAILNGEEAPPLPQPPCRSDKVFNLYKKWRNRNLSAADKFIDAVIAARHEGRLRGIYQAQALNANKN